MWDLSEVIVSLAFSDSDEISCGHGTAEKGMALIKEFSGVLTQDEQKQLLL